jgi:hypothetical protein
MSWLKIYSGLDRRMKIYVSPACGKVANRIELSSGTRVADAREVSDHGYEEGARLPCEPWRVPTAEEAECLVSPHPPPDTARSVSIVKLPGDFSQERREAIRSAEDEAIDVHLVQPLHTICELGEPLSCNGPSANPPNLKTVTFNHDLGRLNGLHVDNWDGLDLENLHLSTNRICLNIGEGDRYFLFLPVSLLEMTHLMSEEMGDDWDPPGRYTSIGRLFMERFPEVPVIRCRLAPGEAYIAPTENLVHDGSSEGQDKPDEQITIRGHIRVRIPTTPASRSIWNKALAKVFGSVAPAPRA